MNKGAFVRFSLDTNPVDALPPEKVGIQTQALESIAGI